MTEIENPKAGFRQRFVKTRTATQKDKIGWERNAKGMSLGSDIHLVPDFPCVAVPDEIDSSFVANPCFKILAGNMKNADSRIRKDMGGFHATYKVFFSVGNCCKQAQTKVNTLVHAGVVGLPGGSNRFEEVFITEQCTEPLLTYILSYLEKRFREE